MSAAERSLYLSFDDDRLADLYLAQLGFLLEEYYRRFPALRGRGVVHWFLDEIQLVPQWERFVRRALDSEKVEIVVSGSSARMLSREVHTSLRGRGVATIIRPFSFREFLRHRGEEPATAPRRWTAADRSLVEKRFRELYPADPGFMGAFDASGRARVGRALETVAQNELERRGAEIGYVKTAGGLEVDFFARHRTGGEELVQVCADPSTPETLARELRALAEAAREHPRARRRLLLLDCDALTRVSAPGVDVKPAYEWLLAASTDE